MMEIEKNGINEIKTAINPSTDYDDKPNKNDGIIYINSYLKKYNIIK